MRRIVITGIGVISSLGQEIASFKQNLFEGVCAIEPMSFTYRGAEVRFPTSPVKDFDAMRWIDPRKVPMLDRFAQFAVVAARQAYQDSGLQLNDEQRSRTGVITGTGVGGQNTLEESYMKLLEPAPQVAEGAPPPFNPRVHPFTIPRLMANAGSSQISMDLGLTGPGFTVASACASALHAIGVAVQWMRSGMIDYAITGGAEACLTFGTLKGWEALRVMAPDVCRPFSAGRSGMVLGEGGAMLMLETLDSAKARGAKIYAELAGFGMSMDAKDITTPDVGGAARAVAVALKDAGLNTDEVQHISAHGTGTRINDQMETAALKQVFGDRAKGLAISASKSQFGHALGGAGGLEILATILAVQNNIAPPTLNYLGVDPECDLDYTPNLARELPITAALKNSFAFGGLNAVIAVKKFA